MIKTLEMKDPNMDRKSFIIIYDWSLLMTSILSMKPCEVV